MYMKRLFSIVLFVLLSVAVMGQMANDYTVRFIGRLNGAHYQRMDSVRFTNLTRGWSETIIYPDTIIVLNATVDVLDNEFKTGGFEQNVPNPFDCHTMVELSVPQDENVRLQLFDAAGKQCAELNVALNAGSHKFEITASKPQAYILKAVAGAKTYSVRMINVGSCGVDGIKYGGYAGLNAKLTTENEFVVGDDMEFVGYATIAGNVVESEIVSMQLRQSQNVVLEFRSETVGMLNGHEWVDLGLPSGLLWATCNVGATNPTDYGNYYAWGETTTKETYSWDTYRYCNGSYNTLTKYCNNSSYGNSGFTDELTTLDASDDAATANWGSAWRMPTFDEFVELITSCTVTYLDYPEYEVPGRLFVGPNGNSIFLPRASELSDNDMFNPVPAHYWSSSLYTGIPSCAWQLYFDPDTSFMHYSGYRSYGRSVRPVWSRANDNDSTTISVPTVITGTASDITTSGAVISGNVISDGGAMVTARGFMYGLNADNFSRIVQVGVGVGSYTKALTGLVSGATYYYRAYARNSVDTAFGEIMSFITEATPPSSLPSGYIDGYGYVDLGLPSGTLWANCNVGATSQEDFGDYFAWGETSAKEIYNQNSYQHCIGNRLTKYCYSYTSGYNGYTDTLTTLEAIDDAATANWGPCWKIPTYDEMNELRNICTVTPVNQNGVIGCLYTGPNGNSIFLPSAGYRKDREIVGSASYWSSKLASSGTFLAYSLGYSALEVNARYYGRSVRPVCSFPTVITSMASDRTTSSVSLNGEVVSDGGTPVIARGFIYGTSADSLSINVQSGSGAGSFSVNITDLSYSIVYYYKAYATNSVGTVYGDMMTFRTESPVATTGAVNGHEWVDLGLPSGLVWETCNVGAETPEGYGDYYAWGETAPKLRYNSDTYTYTDNPDILPASADAATVNWGIGWRMPTYDDMRELLDYCVIVSSELNGINGRMFIGPNGNSIFLPAAGYRSASSLHSVGSDGYYWSSSLYSGDWEAAWYILFAGGYGLRNSRGRCVGFSVRPVCTQ